MSNEVTQAAAIIGAGIVLRIWSHFEHKSSKKDITEIKLSINGEMQKKLDQAKQEGIEEGLKMKGGL